jgi:hypothetical protein
VVCWSQQYNPALSRQDVDAVVGWLNKNFYKLDK